MHVLRGLVKHVRSSFRHDDDLLITLRQIKPADSPLNVNLYFRFV